jgi:hypothetical protein
MHQLIFKIRTSNDAVWAKDMQFQALFDIKFHVEVDLPSIPRIAVLIIAVVRIYYLTFAVSLLS